jgi:tricorn protease
MRQALAVPVLLACAALAAHAGPRGYYRFPAIHGERIVFTAEGDLWTVPRSGGLARRLTSHPGLETDPAISPDGTQVAFSATYEGPAEVYVMPIDGGLPKRLSWLGEDARVVGWTPAGRVLYATRAYSGLPDTQLVAVEPASGEVAVLPLAQASDGCYDRTGGTLFFTRLAAQPSHTKRYRGGTAQQLWKLASGAAEAVPLTADYPGTSKTPMCWRGRVYFASDRDGTMNLWSMAEEGGDLRQLTRNVGWDLASPSLSDGRIAYQLGADIHIFDIESGGDRTLDVTLATDLDQRREKWVDEPMDYLTSAFLSPTGDRVALTARGQVFVAPVAQGRLVEATRKQGVRYRQAHFMPDGKTLVALSDESGEVEWWRLQDNGMGRRTQLTNDGTVLRFDGRPSPDGNMIATCDKNQVLWIVDLKTHVATKIATSPAGTLCDFAWSPDSHWLAYVIPAGNLMTQIKLYETAGGRTLDLTDNRTDSYAPTWSPDGKWIYFLSDRHLETAVPAPWGAYQPEPFVNAPAQIFAVGLTRGLRSPFAPADELEEPAASTEKQEGSGETKPTPRVEIQEEGLADRLYLVPAPPGRYGDLATNGDSLFWLSYDTDHPRKAALVAMGITNHGPKPETLVEGLDRFDLSADGRKLLVVTKKDLAVIDAAAKPKVDLKDAAVDLSQWRFPLAPQEEWRQMFVEAWRLERDYFYDRGMNGIDWQGMRDKYLPLVARVTDREELSDLLGQMVSELSALHIFVRGGDMREGKDDILPASLGASLARDEAAGGWRVRHVVAADPDFPGELCPLARPGVDVHEGDVILTINGAPTLSVSNPRELLRDQAGRQVLLEVKPATGGAARHVIVTPITPREDADLRYSEWELTRRRRVEAEGAGEIGYVHLRAMGPDNYTEWAREFYPVFNRAGLIVDVRHNRGGNIDSWILEKLLRKAWFYWQPRVGQPTWNMQYAFRGHVVVLVDQLTASDGEAFAEGFRRLGLGKVIGMRTWGGEIWLSSSNVLVDKGIATAAEMGVYGPEGEWLIEGWGVEPDIVVDDPPGATFRGEDAQLEAAIHLLQREIRAEPVPVPEHPPYPDKSLRPSH